MFGTCSSSTGCRGCRGSSSKQNDTVKINFDGIKAAHDKENAAPNALREAAEKEKQRLKERCEQEMQKELERQRLEQYEQEQRRQAEERQAAEEKHRVEEQNRHREQLRKAQLEAEQAERRRQEVLRKQEEERVRAEQEEARRQAEVKAKQEKLRTFLNSHGFKSVNEQQKKKGMLSSSFTYPLHVAVKANNLEAVDLLLWAEADKTLKDSSKLAPAALAAKLDKNRSHRAVLDALGK